MKITLQEYRSLTQEHAGYCTKCEEFTHNQCEPDAQRYECPYCGAREVYGLDLAIIALGMVEIIDEKEVQNG
jgi:hypothetical protein